METKLQAKKKKDRQFYKGDYNYPKTAYNDHHEYSKKFEKKKLGPTPEELEEILRLDEELWNS